jgi:hypothetical protein
MSNLPTTTNLPKDQALENAIEDICRYAVKWKEAKQTDDQIEKRLVDAGLSSEAARAVTSAGLARLGRNQRSGRRYVLWGLLCFAGGSILAFALRGGSMIANGAMLLGLLLLLAGAIQLARAPRGKSEIQGIVERVRPTINAEETSHWKIAAVKIHNP